MRVLPGQALMRGDMFYRVTLSLPTHMDPLRVCLRLPLSFSNAALFPSAVGLYDYTGPTSTSDMLFNTMVNIFTFKAYELFKYCPFLQV